MRHARLAVGVAELLEQHAHDVVEYLQLYFEQVKKDAECEVNRSGEALAKLNAMPDVPLSPEKTTRAFDFAKHQS